MSLTMLAAWYLLIPISAAGGGLLIAWVLLRNRSARYERDKLYPVPLTPLRPLNESQWAELAGELECAPDELTDYARRIAWFIVRELRWGGAVVLERPHARPMVLIFDRFAQIVGIDIPPEPMPPDPLLPVLVSAESER